jgi:peptidoglycan/LPS O-acetylase OafA/YrhL
VGVIPQFLIGFGSFGVDVFFVLSGFLLSLPFARAALSDASAPPLGAYLMRRVRRVFPAYYAQLFILLLVGGWFISYRPLDGLALLAHLLMFFNIGWDPVTPMVGVWWTLPVEMGFYLVLPLFALMMRPARWAWFLPLCLLLSMAYRYWAATHFGADRQNEIFLAASQLPGNLPEFLFGASAALLAQYFEVNRKPAPQAWVLDLGLVLGLVLPALWLWNIVLTAGTEYWPGHWSMIAGPTAIGLPLSAAVLCMYWGSRLGRLLFANHVVYYLGLISYSLYLWHFVAMQQFQQFMGPDWEAATHWIKFPVTVLAVVAVASASYYLVERPFFRMRNFREARAAQS